MVEEDLERDRGEPADGAGLADSQDVSSELQRIADRLAQSIGRPVDFDDAHLRLLAHSSHPQQIDPVRLASILNRAAPEPAIRHLRKLGLESVRRPMRVPAAPELEMDARLCLPIRSGEALLGFLWLLDDGGIDETVMQAASNAVREAAEVLEQARLARISVLRRAQPLVLASLESDPQQSQTALRTLVEERLLAREQGLHVALLAERERLVSTARPGGWEHSGESVRGLESAEHGGAGNAIASVRRFTAPADAVFALVPDGLLVLLCLTEDAVERVFEHVLVGHPSLVVGVAAVSGQPSSLATARRRARWAAEAAARDPGDTGLRHWEQMGPYRYLVGLEERVGSLHDLEPAVWKLAGDAGGRELLDTLECFLDLAGSASATAARLNLHRSSLYHRLARAEEALGVNLHDGLQRLDAHLAVKAARTQGLLGG